MRRTYTKTNERTNEKQQQMLHDYSYSFLLFRMSVLFWLSTDFHLLLLLSEFIWFSLHIHFAFDVIQTVLTFDGNAITHAHKVNNRKLLSKCFSTCAHQEMRYAFSMIFLFLSLAAFIIPVKKNSAQRTSNGSNAKCTGIADVHDSQEKGRARFCYNRPNEKEAAEERWRGAHTWENTTSKNRNHQQAKLHMPGN